MRFETQFNFKQEVWEVRQCMVNEWVPCSFCAATGKIKGAGGEERMCPECHGRLGRHEVKGLAWAAGGPLTVGQIRIEHTCASTGGEGCIFDNYGPQKEQRKEEYMCYETGIGSGSIHRDYELFASREEANAEAERKNADSGKEPQNDKA